MSMFYPDDFELITRMQEAKARAEELADFNNAMAGRLTGRSRFSALTASVRQGLEGEKDSMTALDWLMLDQHYAALHRAVEDKIKEIETAIARARKQLQEIIAQADAAVEAMEAAAHRLPDGRVIFRDKETGHVYTADGRDVSDDPAVAGVEWREDAPDWRGYQAQKKRAQQARADNAEIDRFEVEVVGATKDRLNDPHNPPSKEELEQMIEDLEMASLEAIDARSSSTSSPPQPTPRTAYEATLPDFGQ